MASNNPNDNTTNTHAANNTYIANDGTTRPLPDPATLTEFHDAGWETSWEVSATGQPSLRLKQRLPPVEVEQGEEDDEEDTAAAAAGTAAAAAAASAGTAAPSGGRDTRSARAAAAAFGSGSASGSGLGSASASGPASAPGPTSVRYVAAERDWLASELEGKGEERSARGFWADLAVRFNGEFAGKRLAAGEDPRPERTGGAMSAEWKRGKEHYREGRAPPS